MSASRASKQRKPPPQDEHILDTVERLKAVADPVRIRFVLELMEGPKTVKEVAEALDVPPTRLYYHLRILEHHGLVAVASRRMVSGIEERSYRAAYDLEKWTVPPSLNASALDESGALRAMFDMVRAEIEVAIQGKPDVPIEDPDSPIQGISLADLALASDEVPRFRRDLERLLGKYADRPRAPGRNRFRAFYVMYPIPSSATSSEEPD